MNKIHFNWMTVQNFFSVGGEVRVDFNSFSGMNYVYGYNQDLSVKNGSGKSTIFVEAILFGLFNRTSKRVSKGHIVHRLVGKECLVRINFDIDNHNYTVENGINPTFFRILKDGDDDTETKASIKETQDHLEKEILKSTFLVFRNSLVLSINDNKNIFKMSKFEKRQFSEEMMAIERIGRMYIRSKDSLNKLDKELSLKRQSAKNLERDVEEFRSKADSFNADKQEQIAELEVELEDIENQIKTMDTNDDAHQEKRRNLVAMKEKVDEKVTSIRSAVDAVNRSIWGIESDMRNFNEVQQKYSRVLDVLCESCTEKADQALGIDEMKSTLDERTAQLVEHVENKKKLETAAKKLTAETLKKLGEEISHVDDLLSQIDSNRKELQYLSKQFSEKTAALEAKRESQSPFNDLIEKYGNELKCVDDSINAMADDRKYLSFLTFLTSEEGVRKHVLLDYVTILNARIRKYLEEMGCEYTAVFDGELNCEFITTSGPCDYHNFSAGEKVRIDSACMFAFRDLLFGQGTLQSNVFVCDEILDLSLDEYAIHSVIKILKEIAKTQTVFLISHRECVSPEDFNNIVNVRKQNGYTTIVSEIDDDKDN